FFFFSSRRRHTRFSRDWSSDVCSSDLGGHLYALDGEGLKKFSSDGNYTQEVINTEVTGGDGLVILNDSTFVASRWHGEIFLVRRSEERRVGKECRLRWSWVH